MRAIVQFVFFVSVVCLPDPTSDGGYVESRNTALQHCVLTSAEPPQKVYREAQRRGMEQREVHSEGGARDEGPKLFERASKVPLRARLVAAWASVANLKAGYSAPKK